MKKVLLLLAVLSIYTSSYTQSNSESTESDSIKIKETNKKIDTAATRMIDFIVEIRNAVSSDFLIVPQNGVELAFYESSVEEQRSSRFIEAIDGIGVEELYYDSILSVDTGKLNDLEKIKALKPNFPVFVSDYFNNGKEDISAVLQFKQNCRNEGFIGFPRSKLNYDYKNMSDGFFYDLGSDTDVNKLSEVKNYLYYIQPKGSRAELVEEIKKTNFDLLILDLFCDESLCKEGECKDTSIALTKQHTDSLKIKPNGKHRLLLCYLNIGATESYRWYFKAYDGIEDLGCRSYNRYSDEKWVKFYDKLWKKVIISDYLERIIKAGFDGVYLDNTEAYYFLYRDEHDNIYKENMKCKN